MTYEMEMKCKQLFTERKKIKFVFSNFFTHLPSKFYSLTRRCDDEIVPNGENYQKQRNFTILSGSVWTLWTLIKKIKNKPMARQSLREVSQFVDLGLTMSVSKVDVFPTPHMGHSLSDRTKLNEGSSKSLKLGNLVFHSIS
jgi:hypothetical protein